jgi:hypothetical protein
MEQFEKTCSMCGELFSSEKELRDHLRTAHASERRDRRSREPESELDDEESVA